MPIVRMLRKWYWRGGYLLPDEEYQLTRQQTETLLERRDNDGNPVAELVRDEREVAVADHRETAMASPPRKKRKGRRNA